jgi:hypothetical protein
VLLKGQAGKCSFTVSRETHIKHTTHKLLFSRCGLFCCILRAHIEWTLLPFADGAQRVGSQTCTVSREMQLSGPLKYANSGSGVRFACLCTYSAHGGLQLVIGVLNAGGTHTLAFSRSRLINGLDKVETLPGKPRYQLAQCLQHILYFCNFYLNHARVSNQCFAWPYYLSIEDRYIWCVHA